MWTGDWVIGDSAVNNVLTWPRLKHQHTVTGKAFPVLVSLTVSE